MIVGAEKIGTYNAAGVWVDVRQEDLAMIANTASSVSTAASVTGITAFATGGQTNAVQLTGHYNNVTVCATAADSVKLPVSALGIDVIVKNSGAAALAVFPATGGAINGGSANASVTIQPGAALAFYALSATAWQTTTVSANIGGTAAAGSLTIAPNNFHTLGSKVMVSTDGTDYTVVATEVIAAEVFIPANCTITGVALFNGSAVAGNVKVGLFNSAGVLVATSTSTAQTGTDAYQLVPFTATYAAIGPGTYYIGAIGDTGGGTSKINTHTLGAGFAAKQVGQVYATGFTSIAALIATQRAAATPFLTALGPIASLY